MFLLGGPQQLSAVINLPPLAGPFLTVTPYLERLPGALGCGAVCGVRTRLCSE